MGLLQLPPELLLRISSYLTTPEFGSFRQSCKHVEAALFDSFAKEFFTKRQFMIEYISLQTLVDIANHPTLSHRLSEVIISIHTLALDPDERYKAGHVSRDVLLETGQACDMLVEAFSKLPRLRIVGLRDYDASGRFRDGDDARWKSYGWSYGISADPDAALIHNFRNRSMNLASPESTLPVVFYALGRARAKPENIEVFLRRRGKLTPASFNVLDGFMAPTVTPVLARLKKLMLTIALNEPTDFGAPWLPYDTSSVTDASLKRLLHATSELKTLRLNFEIGQFFAFRFLEWLGSPASVSVPVSPANLTIPPVLLSNLTGLDLGMLNVAVPTLINVITKFKITSLNLWKITLHCTDSERTTQLDRWACFLQDLSDAVPASTLKYILIGFVFQAHFVARDSRTHAIRVYFTPPDISSSDLTQADLIDKVTYRAAYGSSVKDWLSDLAKRTSYEIVETSSENGSEEIEDSEEDEDEDEDD